MKSNFTTVGSGNFFSATPWKKHYVPNPWKNPSGALLVCNQSSIMLEQYYAVLCLSSIMQYYA